MERILRSEDWWSSIPWIDAPDADLDAYCRTRPDAPGARFQLKSTLEQWRSAGFVVFQQVVPHALIDEVNSDLQHVLSHHDEFSISVDGSHDVAERYGRLNRIPAAELHAINLT